MWPHTCSRSDGVETDADNDVDEEAVRALDWATVRDPESEMLVDVPSLRKVCVCVHARARVCVRVRACAYVGACVWAYFGACVFSGPCFRRCVTKCVRYLTNVCARWGGLRLSSLSTAYC